MSLLRNSVIVGGATFLVGSALMEISKGDEKVGWWPYAATFLSGALGYYVVKQKTVPVPEALELDAEFRRQGFGRDSFERIDDTELAIHNGKGKRVGKITIEDEFDENDDNVFVLVDGYDANKDYHSQPKAWDGVLHGAEWEIVDIREAEELQSFSAEVFMADRKIRRRTRWTWTRGPEDGYDNKDKVPYSEVYGYNTRQGRGYYSSYVPMYKIEDSYHISDLPEGYHLHLLKPTVRKDSWMAIAKSPNSPTWKKYESSNKAGLTKQLLDWYNKDIATPEVKALTPIDKLKIKKGIKSGKVAIDRVVIPEVKNKKGIIVTPEEIQFYASGGPDSLKPLLFASYFPNKTLDKLKFPDFTFETYLKYEILSFVQGLCYMGEKVTTLRSVNRFNKNREQWVKSYPAWFQNAVRNQITQIKPQIDRDFGNYDADMRITDVVVVKFLNGARRWRWQEPTTERKTIQVYGEDFFQFKVLMPNGELESPRPSTQRKIYESALNQDDESNWILNPYEFALAIVDKYKFENTIPRINSAMTITRRPEVWSDAYRPILELMCRRFKKK